MPKFFVLAVLASGLFAQHAGAAETAPPEVVKAFNEALTRRDLPAALALFAPGAVKYTLHAAHAGMQPEKAGGAITGDLKAHWSQVGSLLFTVMKTYRREVTVVDTRTEGELATVWTDTATQTVERDDKSRNERFGELYLLVHLPEGWKIGAIADNRGTDKLRVNQ